MSMGSSKVRVGILAGRQWGLVTWAQLELLGISASTVAMWLDQGYLHRVLPRVYAVGHRSRTTESSLMAAVLYAGPGATLSHLTAAWWRGLVKARPRVIHVSTPRQCRSVPGIKVHGRRKCERKLHKGLPVTTVAQTLVDLAATSTLSLVRQALANADYPRGVDVAAIEALIGRGRPGSARLRAALQVHQPQLARARSPIEVTFFELCERANMPLPELNVRMDDWVIDAFWREQRVAVELDAYGNHHTPAQMRKDRRKEFYLRNRDITPLRYTDDQVHHDGQAVIADVLRALNSRD